MDQVLSSLTNFLLTTLVAHSVSAEAFGAFTIVMGSYLFGTMLMRSITAEPVLVLYSRSSHHDREQRSRDAMGATLVTAATAGLCFCIASLAVNGDLESLFLLFGLSLPGLLLQDNIRYLLISDGRARAACVNDGCYAVLQIGAVAVLLSTGHSAVFMLALSWAVPGNLLAIVGIAQLEVTPRLAGALDWYRDHKRFWGRYFVEALSSQGGTYVVLYLLAATSGLTASGSLRAAETLFRPASVMTSGVRTALIPELSRRREDTRAVGRACAQIAAILFVLTIAFGVPIVFLPASVGKKILGASWAGAEPLLLYVFLAQLAAVVAMGALIGLRGLADPRRSMRAQVLVTVLQCALGVVGGIYDAALGAAIGLAIAGVLQAVIWWIQLTAGLRSASSPVSDIGTADVQFVSEA